jgi:hypothetical protein
MKEKYFLKYRAIESFIVTPVYVYTRTHTHTHTHTHIYILNDGVENPREHLLLKILSLFEDRGL